MICGKKPRLERGCAKDNQQQLVELTGTFCCSGSQSSSVSERTLEMWTPRLLQTQKGGNTLDRGERERERKNRRKKEKNRRREREKIGEREKERERERERERAREKKKGREKANHRWIPEQSMQSTIPRLMLAHFGLVMLQSAQRSFPDTSRKSSPSE